MNIPFMDLYAGFADYKDEIMDKLAYLIDNTRFIGGEEITLFEQELSEYCGVPHAIGCCNGTEAIAAALKAAGIGYGDTVLVPANTFIGTSEPVTLIGARVDFIDVENETWTMDPIGLRQYMESPKGKNVKAVIPVHLYGTVARMDEIMEIAGEYELTVIEDCAQAIGAAYKGVPAGMRGDLGTISFFPGKNLGAFGDAGGIITKNEEYAAYVKAYINHGRFPGQKYEHEFEGSNMRIDTLQAAILQIKLKRLAEDTERRRTIAKLYTRKLSSIEGLRLPQQNADEAVFHLYVVHLDNRDNALEKLKEAGVSAGVHYPVPLHLQPAYSYLGYTEGDFPNAEYNASHCLSLPLWPQMSDEQVEYVAGVLKEYATAYLA